MSKTYFIGGAPRTGKTMILLELVKAKPMLAASTDAIRSVTKGVLSPEANPRLFRVGRGAFGSEQHISGLKDNPDTILKHEIDSAEETWKSVLDFLSYYQGDGKDTAIEGVAVLPEQLSKVTFDFRAVFVVNLNNPAENILKHARNNPSDWVNKYDESTIRVYAEFNQLWNKFYFDEAKKYNFPVVEIHTNDFDASIAEAVKSLQQTTG